MPEAAGVSLDVEFVRSQFPAFAAPEVARWAHLENAGGSYAAGPVVALLADLFATAKVQPAWDFGPSRKATAAMERARTVMAATFNAAPDEIHFGPSTSQNTYVLANAMRPLWHEGDEIVVTEQDHEANSGAWRRLAYRGIVVREWRVDPHTGLLDADEGRSLIGPRTRLVAMTHASNVVATINPVRAMADAVHAVGGHIVVDGVSAAPHGSVDVRALDCDVYLYSAYKTYGPHVGMMYTRRSVLEAVAHQGHYFNESHLDTRLTPAGPDHAAIGACAGIVDYYDLVHEQHFPDAAGAAPDDAVARLAAVSGLFAVHESALMAPLVEFLVERDGVRLVGAPEADAALRAPTLAFHSERISSAAVYRALIAAEVSCGHGHFYAHRLVQALGLDPDDGVVRLSMVHYNTHDEVARALDVLDPLL
ncbi:MAG: aminotransferase class V-fold PLP-dependent enzyme [Acidimicrobiales bacterium]|nr:aminotransferase class V-fold PLP-dependent enzyme [Acidimicrobiales bacterium]